MSISPDTLKISESIDTNVILRLILRDNFSHTRAAYSLLKDHPRVTYHLSDFAIAEIIYVLENHFIFSRSDIILHLITIFNKFPNINWNSSRLSVAFDFYLNHPALSFDDCYLAVEAVETSSDPLWTFDKALARQHPAATLVQPA